MIVTLRKNGVVRGQPQAVCLEENLLDNRSWLETQVKSVIFKASKTSWKKVAQAGTHGGIA
jgi:hypothetical protein